MGHHDHHHRHHHDFGHDDDHARAYAEYERHQSHHKAKLSHELLAAAVSYQAAKAYNEHCARNGHPNNHETATKVFAAISGAIVDRMIETKGHDFIDKRKAMHDMHKYGQTHFTGIYSG
ncbi:hypothetical protein APHAL10511_002224 [Amanita phalloides]|nr:hypothetical protein APHAL10511_002224 [Amanita phalloides]